MRQDAGINLSWKNCSPGLLVLFFAVLLAHAQSIPTHATSDQIDHWLRSGDSRMVAWGAHFAAETADKGEIPILASLAENYQALPPQEFDSKGSYIPRTLEQKQKFDSMQAVLDALIQFHGTVNFKAVTAVLPDFSAQALTLFATMPEPERSQHAVTLYATRDPSDKKPYDWHQLARQQMIHMAAAILALNPPPGFTATLLNETTVTLKISVTDKDDKRNVTGSGGACGDSFELLAAPGWPQPYTYVVEQHWKSEGLAERILIPGEPAITTRRALSNSSCSTLRGFTSVERFALAQQEAGIPAGALGAGTLEYATLRYPGAADYAAALSALIARYRKPFRNLAEILAGKSFLTQQEAATAVPAFSVEIQDQRQDKTRALPLLPASFGPRVVIGPYNSETGWLLKQAK
jgi:hypothetical protein